VNGASEPLQDGDEKLEAGAGSLTGFELAIEDGGRIGECFPRELNLALKKISAGLRPVRAMRVNASFQVAVDGEEFESFFDESLRIERDEIGLVVVNTLVVGGVQSARVSSGSSAR
jgi:hypothetical protein